MCYTLGMINYTTLYYDRIKGEAMKPEKDICCYCGQEIEADDFHIGEDGWYHEDCLYKAEFSENEDEE